MLVFLTNHLSWRFHHRGNLQDRWQIELFFKAIKQNLKIKTFVEPRSTRSRPRFGQH